MDTVMDMDMVVMDTMDTMARGLLMLILLLLPSQDMAMVMDMAMDMVMDMDMGMDTVMVTDTMVKQQPKMLLIIIEFSHIEVGPLLDLVKRNTHLLLKIYLK